MAGHKCVQPFRERRKAGDVLIAPESPAPSRDRCQEMKNGFGGLIAFAMFEILNRFLEIGARHIGETASGGLPRRVFDPIAGEATPVIDPHPAKGTIAIEGEEWAVRHFLITPFGWGILRYSTGADVQDCRESTLRPRRLGGPFTPSALNFVVFPQHWAAAMSEDAPFTGRYS